MAHSDDMALMLQKEQVIEYARKQGWEIIGITAEHGSGLDFNRKSLKEVMEAVKAEWIDIVLVKNTCRIARDTCRIMACVDEMDKHGVKLMTVDNGEIDFKPLKVAICCHIGSEEQLR